MMLILNNINKLFNLLKIFLNLSEVQQQTRHVEKNKTSHFSARIFQATDTDRVWNSLPRAYLLKPHAEFNSQRLCRAYVLAISRNVFGILKYSHSSALLEKKFTYALYVQLCLSLTLSPVSHSFSLYPSSLSSDTNVHPWIPTHTHTQNLQDFQPPCI